MALKCAKWLEKCQYLQLQDPTKFTQIRIFGLKNLPSGNPGDI
jgi:hypothetical protein